MKKMLLLLMAVVMHLGLSSSYPCPPSGYSTYGEPADCSRYVECIDGIAFLKECAPGLLFHSGFNWCTFPQSSDCSGFGSTTLVSCSCYGADGYRAICGFAGGLVPCDVGASFCAATSSGAECSN